MTNLNDMEAPPASRSQRQVEELSESKELLWPLMEQMGLQREAVKCMGADELVCCFCRGLLDPAPQQSTLSSLTSTAVLVVVDGGAAIRRVLFVDGCPFPSLCEQLQLRLLCVLSDALKDSLYNVVRFCCSIMAADHDHHGNDGLQNDDGGVLRRLLALLPGIEARGRHAVAVQLVRLVGIIGSAGIEARDLKHMLRLLRHPSRLTKTVIEALCTIVRNGTLVAKASPWCFFNMGAAVTGSGGLILPRMEWSFASAYQFCTWFRAETLPRQDGGKASLFTFFTHERHGVELYLKGHQLYLRTMDRRTRGTEVVEDLVELPAEITCRTWYFIDVQHTRSRMAFMGRDLLTVHLDQRPVYRGTNRYPKNIAEPLVHCSIGEGFDGQMAPVYVFHDPISQPLAAILAQHSASMPKVTAIDLDPSPLGLTPKAFASKVALVYHPDRCVSNMCLDLHGGMHGMLGKSCRASALDCARDVIASVGGVAALFPLFYLMLIAEAEGQGPQKQKKEAGEEAEGGLLALLLSMLARTVRAHDVNQKEMHRIGGIEMLEYIILRTPASLLQREDSDSCVRAVMEVCTACSGYLELEAQAIRRLLNPILWCHAPVRFQLQLLRALLGYVRSSPWKLREILNISTLLDAVRDHYSTFVGESTTNGGAKQQQAAQGSYGSVRAPNRSAKIKGNPSLIRMFRASTFAEPVAVLAEGGMVGGVSPLAAASVKDRDALRQTALQIIICLCHVQITAKELRPILQVLAAFTQRESDLAEEILQVLLYWLLQDMPPAGLLDTIRSMFGSSGAFVAFLVLGVVNRDFDHLRATGVRVLNAYLIREDMAEQQSGGGEEERIERRAGGAMRGPLDRALAAGGVSFLYSYLQQHVGTIDEHTYAALLEMVLASRENLGALPLFSKSVVTTSAFIPSRLQPTKIIDDIDRIENVTVLTVILKLLPSLAYHLKERAYGDLLLLLKFSQRNRTTFVTVAGWQVSLFELMASSIYKGDESGGLTYEPNSEVPSLLGHTPATDAHTYMTSQRIEATGPEADGGSAASGQDLSVDHWIDMGMKLYVLLLSHVLERPPGPSSLNAPGSAGGWQEIARALSLERSAPQGRLVLISLCSQLLADITSDLHVRIASLLNRPRRGSPTAEHDRADAGEPRAPAGPYIFNLTASAFLISAFLTGPSAGMNVLSLSIQGLNLPPLTVTTDLPISPVRRTSTALFQEEDGASSPEGSPRMAQPPQSRPHTTSPPHSGSHSVPRTRSAKDMETFMDSGEGSVAIDRPLPPGRPPPMRAIARGSSRSRSTSMPSSGVASYTTGGMWSELCRGTGRSALFHFPRAHNVVFGRKVSEGSGTVLVATQLLQLLDGLVAGAHSSVGPRGAPTSIPAPPAPRSEPVSLSTLAFLQQHGPLQSSGTILELMLRLSLFALNTVHPLHPLATINTARLRRLARYLTRVSPFTKSLESWLTLLVAHVHNALRRLRDLIDATIAEQRTSHAAAASSAKSADAAAIASPTTIGGDTDRTVALADPGCVFCTGELQSVVTAVEDLFEVLYMLNSERSSVLSHCTGKGEPYFKLCSMLRDRHMAYLRQTSPTRSHHRTSSTTHRSSPAPGHASNRRRGSEPATSMRDFAHQAALSDGKASLPSWPESPSTPTTNDSRRSADTPDTSEDKVNGSGYCRACSQSFSRRGGENRSRPWKLQWLDCEWLDHPLTSESRVRSAASALSKADNAMAKEYLELTAACYDQQMTEESLHLRSVDSRSPMYLDGRTLKSQLEEMEHQRMASRAVSLDLQQRSAIAKWATVMRTLSAEWSSWAVQDAMSRWKTSTHEDSCRRRMLLTQTDQYDDHQDAAYKTGHEGQDFGRPGGLLRQSSSTGSEVQDGDAHELDPLAKSTKVKKIILDPAAPTEDSAGEEDAASDESPVVQKHGRTYSTSSVVSGTTSPPRTGQKERPAWSDDFGPGEHLYFHPDRGSEAAVAQFSTGRPSPLSPDTMSAMSSAANGDDPYVGRMFKEKKWRLDRITEVHGRRHLLQSCALEMYFTDAHELLVAFSGIKERKVFFDKLTRQYMPLLITPKMLRPSDVLRECKYTDMWRRRQMSNFEYLMKLNIIAGRSYNDINQYPVFPWILADYSSQELDLTNPETFRDLSKPVGALDEARLAWYLERYEMFDDPVVPKFMYGSHYSSAGLVLHFLMRQEPFATLAIRLQSGTFDCPDRLFFDIVSSWESCHRSTTDVKELVPELFSVPEVLLNTNKYPLGTLSEGNGDVGDVRLPPWAKGSAHEFVRLHRLALESEYVSMHLHQWIDLIFGYKQRGQRAVEAHNVFYYLTYEGAVDLDEIDDPMLREATQAQIKHYGQTPSQLLTKPHPRRLPPEECVQPICSSIDALNQLRSYTPAAQLIPSAGPCPVLSVRVAADKLVVVFADLSVATYRWSAMPDVHDFPFTVRPERIRQLPCQAVSMSSYAIFDHTPSTDRRSSSYESAGGRTSSYDTAGTQLHTPRKHRCRTFDEEMDDGEGEEDGMRRLGPWNFALAGDRLICCGTWDHVVKMYGLDGLKLQANTSGGHRGAVNCLEVGADGRTLVTGGQDGTCRVWVADSGGGIAAALRTDSAYLSAPVTGAHTDHHDPQGMQCVAILWGHDTAVISVSLSTSLDLLASGSMDGTVVMHQVHKAKYVRRISYPGSHAAHVMHLAEHNGDLVLHSWTDRSLHRYSLNGFHLAQASMRERVLSMTVTRDGHMVVAGTSRGCVVIMTVHDLQHVHEMQIGQGPIRSLAVTPDHQYVLLGCESGRFAIVADPLSRLQMLHRVLNRTFFGVMS